jgi:hypothetical protein
VSISSWIKSILLRPIPDLSDTYKETPIAKELPEMLIHLKLWGNNAQILWTYHILLGFLATLFTILSASLIDVIDNIYIKIFSIIAAISISVLAAFSLGTKSNNVRAAWRKLNTAIIKFNAKLIDKIEVIQAYEDGEALIGGVSYSPDQIEIPEKNQEKNVSNTKSTIV